MSSRKLVLYSNQLLPGGETAPLDWRLFDLITKKNPRIGYIPSRSDPDRKYWQARREFYAYYGADLAVYLELDNEYDPRRPPDLLSCDAIHLSGGDTFYFARWLAARNLQSPLREYSERGGVLIGVSAGAILLATHIATALLCGDTDPGEDTAHTPLGLVDVAFVPHINKGVTDRSALEEFARRNQTNLYACTDSAGLVISGNYIECVGEHWKISARKAVRQG